MHRQYDDYDASHFAVATKDIISRADDRHGSGETKVILSTGPRGGTGIRRMLKLDAVEKGKSVVHLEFSPGRENKGPATVAVLRTTRGVPADWTDCALWSPEAGGGLLVAKDGSAAFQLDGGDLVRVEAPARHALQAGFARGRRELAAAAKRLKAAQSGLDVERVSTITPPTPAEHRATARRVADAGAMPGADPSDEPSFTLEIGDELLIRLASERAVAPGRRAEPVCVLRLQPGDLMPFMIWLGERREMWRGWRTYGTVAGGQALGQAIGALRRETGGVTADALDIDVHRDWMGIDLVAEFPGRTVKLGSHRFVREGDAGAFRDRYRSADNATRWALFEAACLLTRRDLTRLIETVLAKGSTAGDAGSVRRPTVH